MTAYPYIPAYLPLAKSWWRARHNEDLPDALLPPCGCVVEDDHGPAVMLFCEEPAMVSAARIEWPLSRTGLSLTAAKECFKLAIENLVSRAGKEWKPPANYTAFRACADVVLARAMESIGWEREGPLKQPMIFVVQ